MKGYQRKKTMITPEQKYNCKYCNSDSIVKDGTSAGEQYYLCRSCNRRFNLKDALLKMRTPIDPVSAAVSMYFNGLSLGEVRQELRQIYDMDVSEVGIYGWIERFAKDAIEITKRYHPKVGYVWMADETTVDINGKKCWLWDIEDVKTRYLIASYLSETRMVEDAQKVLQMAYQHTGVVPKVIMTDSLRAYINAIRLTFGQQTKHVQIKKFDSPPNNNIIERMQGTIRARTKIMRGLKSINTADVILKGFLVNYNYFRPHETLSKDGTERTPADKAQVQFPYKNWEDLIRHSQEAKFVIPSHYKQLPQLPVILPTSIQRIREKERNRKRIIRAGIRQQRANRPTLSSIVISPRKP
jgi:putative transposase